MEIKKKDVLVCGFALFAIFFGAGNLIFPPYLGVLAGDKWYEAMLGFLLSDPVLPILGVIVTAKLGGKADDLGKRVSPKFARVIGIIIILTIGPLFAIPRTGATTHEIFVKPLFPAVPIWVTGLVFFGLTLYLTLNPGKVVDIIGNYLTPCLLLVLAIIVGIAIIKPPGALVSTDEAKLFMRGFTEGYQTMDALAAALIAGIVASDLVRRGYTDEKVQFKASIQVGMVAFVLLALVYGGLTYAGATVGEHFTPDTPRTEILVGLVTLMLGGPGKVILGIAVALACLTTSTGLASICGNFISSVSKGKLPYKGIVVVSVVVSYVLSLIGVDGLIKFAGPILTALYPVIIVLIFMSLFDEAIKYNLTYTGAVVGAFIIAIVEAINLAFILQEKTSPLASIGESFAKLPLASIGFSWFIPAVVCSVIFTAIAAVGKVGKKRGDALE